MKICQFAKEKLNDESSLFLPSAVFGKRIIIPASFNEFQKIDQDDFVELIDYNPVTNTLLYLGPKIPSNEVAVHWIVHHAKKEIQVIIQIKNISDLNKIKQKITKTSIDENDNALDKAKKWLKTLQKNEIFLCDDVLIVTASSIKKLEQNLKKMSKELEKL